MTSRPFRLNMGMMYAVHDAFRRDLEQLARIAARTDDDPRRILRTAAGWEMFKTYLITHHVTEDEALWPVTRHIVTDQDRPDDLALLDAMEAEHAAIDPMLEAVDAALADRESGPQRLGDLIDALHSELTKHLQHEEEQALPLLDDVLTEEQWRHFGDRHRERIGTHAPRYLPWVLDGLSPDRAAPILAGLPAPIRTAYQDEWLPAYTRLNRWEPAD